MCNKHIFLGVIPILIVFAGAFLTFEGRWTLPTSSCASTIRTVTKENHNAVTGSSFDGNVILYPSALKQNGHPSLRRNKGGKYHCQLPLIGVVTTLKATAHCIKQLTEFMPVIIVGDEGSDGWNFNSLDAKENVTYLSFSDQKKHYPDFHKMIPSRHFSRKNFGFVYALVEKQACFIWDFDDDNCVTKATRNLLENTMTLKAIPQVSKILYMPERKIVNPYVMYGSNEYIWPRGFPLEHISKQEFPVMVDDNLDLQLEVLQVMQQVDPDVDAVWRLLHGSRELPMVWQTDTTLIEKPVGIHPAQFAPFNAQSTLIGTRALPFIYLPHTVHGRVSDIWRSYILQYMLSLVHGPLAGIGFSGAFVDHWRNSHNYMADMDAEGQLYSQVEALTKYLLGRRPSEKTMEDEYILLMDDLYRRGFLGEEDVHAAQLWVSLIAYSGSVGSKSHASLPLVDRNNTYHRGPRIVENIRSIPLVVATENLPVNTSFLVASQEAHNCNPKGISGVSILCCPVESNREYGVVGILSAGGKKNQILRMTQRETWIKDSVMHHIRVFFLIDNETPEFIAENDAHGDIIFLNSTYSGRANHFGEKLYLWLKIAHDLFPSAVFVGKIDDDCIVCAKKMWPFVWEHLSPSGTDYVGYLHGFNKFQRPYDIGLNIRIDEMFVLLGHELVARIASREYCHQKELCDEKVNLIDTNYGGTSLGVWLSIYDDVFTTPINNIMHGMGGDFRKHRNRETGCSNYHLIHPVKTREEMLEVYTYDD